MPQSCGSSEHYARTAVAFIDLPMIGTMRKGQPQLPHQDFKLLGEP